MASITCRQCGLPVQPQDSFCQSCGASTASSPLGGVEYTSKPVEHYGGQPDYSSGQSGYSSSSPSPYATGEQGAQTNPLTYDPGRPLPYSPNQPGAQGPSGQGGYPPVQPGQLGGQYPNYPSAYPNQGGGYYPNQPGGYPYSNQPPASSDVPVVAPYAATPQFPAGGYYADPRYWIWRQGNQLVFHEHAQLPDSCIKCNEPAFGKRLEKKLSWVNPLYSLLVILGLLGIIAYLIIASITRKSAYVSIGFCERHLQLRRTWLIVSWALLAASILGFVLAIAYESGWTAGAALVMLIGSIVSAIVWSRFVGLKKIENQYIWLSGVDQGFLAQFPQSGYMG